MTDWMQEIHRSNIYEGFDPLPLDLDGWGEQSPIFEYVCEVIKPQTIIEVGTWKGASALRMAALMKQGTIVCVDTWLGSIHCWNDRTDPKVNPYFVYGYPQLYWRFLSNVVHHGKQALIVPFPATSSMAAQFLKARGMSADAIYIDASHDYEDVTADLKAYWELLRPGGIMFGDDYDPYWPGVMTAVNEFAIMNGLRIDNRFMGKSLMVKP